MRAVHASATSAIRSGASRIASSRRWRTCSLAEISTDCAGAVMPDVVPMHADREQESEPEISANPLIPATRELSEAALPRLPRDDAGRPARPRGHAAVLHRAVRQSAQQAARVRLGGARRHRHGARAGGGAHQRERRRDRLHQRRDRVEQPRACAAPSPPRTAGSPRRPRHHRRDRAQVRARRLPGSSSARDATSRCWASAAGGLRRSRRAARAR